MVPNAAQSNSLPWNMAHKNRWCIYEKMVIVHRFANVYQRGIVRHRPSGQTLQWGTLLREFSAGLKSQASQPAAGFLFSSWYILILSKPVSRPRVLAQTLVPNKRIFRRWSHQRANHIFWDAFFNQQPATKGASFVPRCQNKSHWLVDFHGYVHAEIPNSIISIFVGYINPKWCW